MKGIKGFLKGNRVGYVHGAYRSKELRSIYMAFQNMISRFHFVPYAGWYDFPDFLEWSLKNGYEKGKTNFCRLDEKDIHCPENSIWKPKGKGLLCLCCDSCSKMYWITASESVSCPACGGENFTLLSRRYLKRPWGILKDAAKRDAKEIAKKDFTDFVAGRSKGSRKKMREYALAAEKRRVEAERLARKQEREKEKKIEREMMDLLYFRKQLVKVLNRRIQDAMKEAEKERKLQEESNRWNRSIVRKKKEVIFDPIVYDDDGDYKPDFLRGF